MADATTSATNGKTSKVGSSTISKVSKPSAPTSANDKKVPAAKGVYSTAKSEASNVAKEGAGDKLPTTGASSAVSEEDWDAADAPEADEDVEQDGNGEESEEETEHEEAAEEESSPEDGAIENPTSAAPPSSDPGTATIGIGNESAGLLDMIHKAISDAGAALPDVAAAGVVLKDGYIYDEDGDKIGKLLEGDADDLAGSVMNDDGEIINIKDGSVVGIAEPLDDDDDEDEEGASDPTAATDAGKVVPGGASKVATSPQVETAHAPVDTDGPAGADGVPKNVGDVATASDAGSITPSESVTAVGKKAKKTVSSAKNSTEAQLGDKKVNEVTTSSEEAAPKTPGLNAADITTEMAKIEKPNSEAQKSNSKAKEATGSTSGKPTAPKSPNLEDFEVSDNDRTEEKLPTDEAKKGPDSTEEIEDVTGSIDEKPVDHDNPEAAASDIYGDKLDKTEGKNMTAESTEKEVAEVFDTANTEVVPAKAAGDAVEGVEQTGEDGVEEIEAPALQGPFNVNKTGSVLDGRGEKIGSVVGSVKSSFWGDKEIAEVDEEQNLLDKNGTVLGQVDLLPVEELPVVEVADLCVLDGLKITKAGFVVQKDGTPVGKIVEGDAKRLAGKVVDKKGLVWNNSGKQIGRAEVLPDVDENNSAPFEDFEGATVDKSGKILYNGDQVGTVVEGDLKKMIGKRVDADGEILDRFGNFLGRAERADEEEPEVEQPEEIVPEDLSSIEGKKVNKLGNVVDDQGRVLGRIKEGVLKALIGKTVGKHGIVFNAAGKAIGKAELIPDDEKEDFAEPGPFEDFEGAIIRKDGFVVFESIVVGKLASGDAKKLVNKQVDVDGEVLDRRGNLLGKAERYQEDEAPPEPEVDMSALAGKRVNKSGNVCDKHGDVFGRVVEGDVKRLVGKVCDKLGNIRNEGGDVIGKAELVPEAERDGLKLGPFTDFKGCTVNREGKVVTMNGEIVGRLIQGDGKTLFGRAVDDDGEIVDANGNVTGKAERWDEPEEVKENSPMFNRKVNKKGEVVSEDGDVIGKLTDGKLFTCAGKKIDADGDVLDGKNNVIGHVSLLEDIPDPEPEPDFEPEPSAEPEEETQEPEESEEEREARLQVDRDNKLAEQMANCISQSLDKVKPILKMITQKIDAAERQPEDERDEEELVKAVRPLIEEGGAILTEANGAIRGLDPDGRIAANAKHKTAAREATPAEYRLAELLKELAGHVTETIDNAKQKLEDMNYAKKELNPLWGLLSEPLFQILAAVGLLLSGVLGLVGKLLSGLGLGGLVDSLLGGLGLTRLLDSLGLGSIVGSITGKSKGKKGKGLLG